MAYSIYVYSKRPSNSFWKCPKCGKTMRAHSAYHLKSCKGSF